MNDHGFLFFFFSFSCPILDKRELFFTFYIVAEKILYLVGLAITHVSFVFFRSNH